MTLKKHFLMNHPDRADETSSIWPKSPVWRFFSMIDKTRAGCDLCGKTYCAKGGTTTELRNHLMRSHQNSSDVVETFSEEKINMSVDNNAKLTNTKSLVWMFFKMINKSKTRCNLCPLPFLKKSRFHRKNKARCIHSPI